MSALPKEVNLDPQGVSAWNLLLAAEDAALKKDTRPAKYRDELVGVRVLGFFLLDFYKHSNYHQIGLIPYKRLVREVLSCFAVSVTDNEAVFKAVFELGLSYRNHLIRVFRSNSGPRPSASSHASRPSFDQMKLEMIKRMQKADKSKSDVKSAALFRDGYRCMITGAYDLGSCVKFPEILALSKVGVGSVSTECAHLFSESAQDGDKPSEYAGTAFTMLKMFGLEHEVEKLLGGRVNTLSNVLTLSHDMHEAFDRFAIWLEEVPGQENNYIVEMAENEREALLTSIPRPATHVTFKVDPDCVAFCKEDGMALPELPSRDLIGLRAACARVANMSGAAEQIDQIYRDEEDTTVMAYDGSTGDLLSSLLNARVIAVGGG